MHFALMPQLAVTAPRLKASVTTGGALPTAAVKAAEVHVAEVKVAEAQIAAIKAAEAQANPKPPPTTATSSAASSPSAPEELLPVELPLDTGASSAALTVEAQPAWGLILGGVGVAGLGLLGLLYWWRRRR